MPVYPGALATLHGAPVSQIGIEVHEEEPTEN
jgi:hypothetical protein